MRSASFAAIACRKVIAAAAFETGRVHEAGLSSTRSGCRQRERAVHQVAGVGRTVSAASPAVEITFAVVVAVYSRATPGVNAPNDAAGPSVSASVAGHGARDASRPPRVRASH